MDNSKIPNRTDKKTLKIKDPTEVEDFLRLYISQFKEQKNKILDEINELHDMNEATFALREQLNQRNGELAEIKATVSNLQFTIVQQQDQNMSLLKENDYLQQRLGDYQKKVEILLSYANIPKDFPILSLLKCAKGDIIVERKQKSKPKEKEFLDRANKKSSNTCECSVHKCIKHFSDSQVCNNCGKLVQKGKDSNTNDICSAENIKACQNAKSVTMAKNSNEKQPKSNVSMFHTTSDYIDDVEQSNLVIQSLKARLCEIKYNYDQHTDLLLQDKKLLQQEHKKHIENIAEECDYYNTYVKNLQSVLYNYLYEDVSIQHMGTSCLTDMYKYMICVQKCKQLLGDKFPQCVKSYLMSSKAIEFNPLDHETNVKDYEMKIERLQRKIKQLQEVNTHLSLAVSSAKIKQQENLMTMNERVNLYRRKHEELLERKNQESRYYRKQIDSLALELERILG